MMNSAIQFARERRAFFVSLILAFLMMMVPWSPSIFHLLPAWVFLVLCYWSLHHSFRVSLWLCWFIGLFVDVCDSSLLGQHAFIFALLVYFLQKMQRQIRLFPIRQQVVLIGFMVLLHQMFTIWIHGITGQNDAGSALLWTPFTSGLGFWCIKNILDKYLMNYHDHLHHPRF